MTLKPISALEIIHTPYYKYDPDEQYISVEELKKAIDEYRYQSGSLYKFKPMGVKYKEMLEVFDECFKIEGDE